MAEKALGAKPARYIPSYQRQLHLAAQSAQRLEHVRRTQETADQGLADRVGRLYRAYPWARPGVLLSVARAGLEPGDRTAQWMGAVAAAQRDRDPLGWMAPGERGPSEALDVAKRMASRQERVTEQAPRVQRDPIGKLPGPGANVDESTRMFGGTPVDMGDMPDFSEATDPVVARQQWVNDQARAGGIYKGQIDKAQIGTGAAPAVFRYAGAAANTPLQTMTGGFREIVNLVHPPDDATVDVGSPFDLGSYPERWGRVFGQTEGGVIAQNLIAGEGVDTGSGFFVDPDSEVGQERLANERSYGTVGGSALTPGRLLASTVVEPGTRPYTVISGLTDFTVAVVADPTNLILGEGAAARAASQELSTRAAGGGLLAGTRRTIDVRQVENFLASDDFATAAQRLADTDRPAEVRRLLGSDVPAEVSRAIADDAHSIDDVRAIVQPHVDANGRPTGIGLDIRNPVDTFDLPSDLGLHIRPSARNARIAGMLPQGEIMLDDVDHFTEFVERSLRNANAPTETVDDFVSRAMRTDVGIRGRNQRRQVLVDMMAEESGLMVGSGVPEPIARQLTHVWDEATTAGRVYAMDHAAGDVLPAWANPLYAGDDAEELASDIGPLLLSQHVNGVVPAPDARAIRRMTSNPAVRALTANAGTADPTLAGQMRLPQTVLMELQDAVWKPLQLLRAAWVVRVVGEEQLRVVASDLEGVNHPIRWLSWMLDPRRRMDAAGNDVFARGPDAADDFARAQARGDMGFMGAPTGRVTTTTPVRISRDATTAHEQAEYGRWWANEIAMRANDPISQRVADDIDDLDSVREWFRPGNPVFDAMADAHPVLAERRAVANAYIDQLADDIRFIAGANPATGSPPNEAVLNAIRTGEWDAGADVRFPLNDPGSPIPTPDGRFIQALDRQRLTGPEAVVGRATARTSGRGRTVEAANNVVNWMFGALGAKPTNYLSRSPAFRQFYWRRMEEMIPLADGPTQELIIEGARRAGLSRSQVRRLRSFAQRGTGEAELEGLDQLAKGHALDDTRNLLYDLTERSQFFDATRLIFPFGEAWGEVISRWAGLLRRNPRMARRAQQGVQALRGSGFFFTDENDQESFAYPATGALMNALGVNAPTRLLGSAQGLNMAAQVMPGFGPYVQMAVVGGTQNRPEYRGVREVVAPFGDTGDDVFGILAPPWMERIQAAAASPGDINLPVAGGIGGTVKMPDVLRDAIRYVSRKASWTPADERAYNTSVGALMSSLMASGEYGTSPAEQRRLERDAREQATSVMFLRGVSAFFAPSSPRPEYRAEITGEGDDPQTAVIRRLSEEYHDMQAPPDEGGMGLSQDEALAAMIARYGENIWMAMQGASVSTTIEGPVSAEGLDWVADHEFTRERYPGVYGLFAPQGEFDIGAFMQSYEEGSGQAPGREGLTPTQIRLQANDLIGRMEWQQAQAQAGPESERTPEVRQALRELHAELKEHYEGFDSDNGVPPGPSTEDAIHQLTDAADDPELADAAPEAVEALRLYLAARDEVAQAALDPRFGTESGNFQDAQGTAPLRSYLRAYADWLIGEHPEFRPMWDRVFSRELHDDAAENAPEGG